jgi:hypothetical protein
MRGVSYIRYHTYGIIRTVSYIQYHTYGIIYAVKRRKSNWIGHVLRRNCLLKHVIEGKIERRIEVMGRRGRRGKQLLDDL